MKVDGGGSLEQGESSCNYLPHHGNYNLKNKSASCHAGDAKGPIV